MNYIEDAKKILRDAGKRITSGKLAVLEVLNAEKKPLNAYEIAEKAASKGKSVDVVSVYRVLDGLKELSLVHKAEKGFVKCQDYQCGKSEHCHHQFLCESCEQAVELHIDERGFIKMMKEKFKDLSIKSHFFSFRGLCGDCKKI